MSRISLRHYDTFDGHVEVLREWEEAPHDLAQFRRDRAAAEQMRAYLQSQDHGTDSSYLVDVELDDCACRVDIRCPHFKRWPTRAEIERATGKQANR